MPFRLCLFWTFAVLVPRTLNITTIFCRTKTSLTKKNYQDIIAGANCYLRYTIPDVDMDAFYVLLYIQIKSQIRGDRRTALIGNLRVPIKTSVIGVHEVQSSLMHERMCLVCPPVPIGANMHNCDSET